MSLTIDRDTASRLGISPQLIDDTLYDAFGQRQISIIFTQLNMYRVILELKPEYQQDPRALDKLYVNVATGNQVPLSTFVKMTPTQTPLAIDHQGQFPSVTLSFDLVYGVALGEAVDAITRGGRARLPPGVHADFQGTRAGLPRVARERAGADPRGAHHRLHRARRALRELHPPDHDPLDAAVRRRRRAARADGLPHGVQRHRADRHHAPHRHREEERDHDDRLRARGGARARIVAARVDLSGVPASFPAHHDDDDGGAARRRAARARHRHG